MQVAIFHATLVTAACLIVPVVMLSLLMFVLERLAYDRNSGQYSSVDDDIEVSVPGFGDTVTVEDIGQAFVRIVYFQNLVQYFVDRGYERGKDIQAAPYDWRLAPGNLSYTDLQSA